MPNIGKVITFYSYKGGVGRSMSMANIAVLLAKWGKKVLIVDWDLEAPGLEHFFYDRKKEEIELERIKKKKGVIDILLSRAEDEKFTYKDINWEEYQIDLTHRIDASGELKLITSGQKSDDYIDKVRRFSYSDFYDTKDGGFFLEQIRTYWVFDHYDYILIDSRTGLTESGGVCTIQMPDILILLFTPNEQSLKGVTNVAKRSLKKHFDIPYTRQGLTQLFIPTRFDDLDPVSKQEWLQIIDDELTPVIPWLPYSQETKNYLFSISQLIEQIKIPYKAKYAYGEKIAVLEEGTTEPGSIGFVIETVTAILANNFTMIESLNGSRDNYIKVAKGEQAFPPNDLRAKLSIIEKEKEKLKIALNETSETLLTKEAEQKKEKITKRVLTVLLVATLIAATFSFWMFYVDKRQAKQYNRLFLDSLTLINSYNGNSKYSAICKLANYENKYDDSNIARLKDSLNNLCIQIKKNQQIISSSTNILKNIDKNISKATQNRAAQIDTFDKKINNLKDSISRTKDKTIQLNLKRDSVNYEIKKQEIIDQDPILKTAESPTQELQKAVEVNQSIASNKDVVKDAYSSWGWAKEGFYLQFENYKVIVRDIDKNGKIVKIEVCDMIGSAVCTASKPYNISSGSPCVFSDSKYNYKITLDRIGHAGGNPFTLAAYITFTRTPK
ncbi:KGGVGR-motif variant AAA ATPase [Mucilaginibacter endophyticus]|uniref:KGGVGR-motif variant AAA ATPase n=1 Tax=Mucilaginibacter endophyticus TaxID=2675003 RepID=UPI000E0DA868|nr:AAA family ATPase [Mucilaginibacter endophyticus]